MRMFSPGHAVLEFEQSSALLNRSRLIFKDLHGMLLAMRLLLVKVEGHAQGGSSSKRPVDFRRSGEWLQFERHIWKP
jgi:hypothetical protein